MASDHSYRITLSNNKTERAGIDYLLDTDPGLWLPKTPGDRRDVLESMGVESKRFARAFDLIRAPGVTLAGSSVVLEGAAWADIQLVELKTTMKRLPDNPHGFFFGATENEFALAEALGDRYQFCFVSLHPETLSHAFLTLRELEPLMKSRRIQYQITLGKKP